jgi:hypothetical protein
MPANFDDAGFGVEPETNRNHMRCAVLAYGREPTKALSAHVLDLLVGERAHSATSHCIEVLHTRKRLRWPPKAVRQAWRKSMSACCSSSTCSGQWDLGAGRLGASRSC